MSRERTAPAPSENDDQLRSVITKTRLALCVFAAETTTNAPVVTITPARLQIRMRRRSCASASAPPKIVTVTSGTNCAIARMPTARLEPVMSNICTDTSTGSMRHAM